MLAQQIEQRRFHRGHRVDHHAQVESLLAAAAGIAVGELFTDRGEDIVTGPDGGSDDEWTRILQRAANFVASRHLANADVTRIVRKDNEVARKERPLRPGEVEKHAVAARDRNDVHARDDGRTGKTAADRFLDHGYSPSFCGQYRFGLFFKGRKRLFPPNCYKTRGYRGFPIPD